MFNVHNCSNVEKVILDFHALQSCDIGIISASGFGQLGITNRIDPTKDLYLFENYIFKKFESLDMF